MGLDFEELIIGKDEYNPILEIQNKVEVTSNSIVTLPKSQAVSDFISGAIGLIPFGAISHEFKTHKFMEVIAHGDLINAKDGNGYRALIKGADGKFTEHARLFDPEKLSQLVNVAMVWQIASFAVAQKHLADINEKLEKIQETIGSVARSLERQRQSRLFAIQLALKDLIEQLEHLSIEKHSKVINLNMLSMYEIDLKDIFINVLMNIEEDLAKKVKHTEMFGSKDLTDDLSKKLDSIDNHVKLAILSLELMAICCQLISYMPDIIDIQIVKKRQIKDQVARCDEVLERIENEIESEINSMNSFTNKLIDGVKNNPTEAGMFIGSIGGGLGMALGATVGKVVAIRKNQSASSEDKINTIETRRKNLKALLESMQFQNFLKTTEIIKMISLDIRKHSESEPIKLTFEKKSDNELYCLNTKETFMLSV